MKDVSLSTAVPMAVTWFLQAGRWCTSEPQMLGTTEVRRILPSRWTRWMQEGWIQV